jgi:hypothetical protein
MYWGRPSFVWEGRGHDCAGAMPHSGWQRVYQPECVKTYLRHIEIQTFSLRRLGGRSPSRHHARLISALAIATVAEKLALLSAGVAVRSSGLLFLMCDTYTVRVRIISVQSLRANYGRHRGSGVRSFTACIDSSYVKSSK